MTSQLASSMRIFWPYPNVIAFYDGRIPGVRKHSEKPNWLDDGAFSLGCCSFAIVDEDMALVYDTHMSIPHAQVIRRTLEDLGVTQMRVMLSHWHVDHIAGNAAFADCEIIANDLTAQAMVDQQAYLENSNPPIHPVVMPGTVFARHLTLAVGRTIVECHHFDIHSHDGNVLLLPQTGVLLAGDTLEDTVTYVAEPERLAIHLGELGRLALLGARHILPNHGSEARIAAGGYASSLIGATRLYVEKLLRLRSEPGLASLTLSEFAAEALATGGVEYFDAYEPIHRHNVAAVLATP